jgi:hypothetical protein
MPDLANDNPAPDAGSITHLIYSLRNAVLARPEAQTIALRDVLAAMAEDSFILLMLVFALLLVSPLSAIPMATTAFGLTIASILLQYFLRRRTVWLPGFLLDRQVPVARTLMALDWLEKPARWLDRRLRPRLRWVLEPPLALGLKMLVCAAAFCAPLMEVIPASGTSVGAAITLFGAGLLARDGVFVLVGASLAAILPVTLWMLIG